MNILDLTNTEPTLTAYGKAFDIYYEEHGCIDKIVIPKYIQDGAFNTVFGPLEKWRGVPLEVKDKP